MLSTANEDSSIYVKQVAVWTKQLQVQLLVRWRRNLMEEPILNSADISECTEILSISAS